MRRRGRAYPGARESLERLGREPGVVQGLLTGNIPANARVKLRRRSGLDDLVDFDIGGYGSDHRLRSELVAVALRPRERKLGVRCPTARGAGRRHAAGRRRRARGRRPRDRRGDRPFWRGGGSPRRGQTWSSPTCGTRVPWSKPCLRAERSFN